MTQLKPFFILAAVATLALAGCVEDPSSNAEITKKYTDAKIHYANHVAGSSQDTKTVNVAATSREIRVAAAYDVAGSAAFTLMDPTGKVVKKDEIAGARQNEGVETWFSATNPFPGTWTLKIDIDGGGAYAFGFYY